MKSCGRWWRAWTQLGRQICAQCGLSTTLLPKPPRKAPNLLTKSWTRWCLKATSSSMRQMPSLWRATRPNWLACFKPIKILNERPGSRRFATFARRTRLDPTWPRSSWPSTVITELDLLQTFMKNSSRQLHVKIWQCPAPQRMILFGN